MSLLSFLLLSCSVLWIVSDCSLCNKDTVFFLHILQHFGLDPSRFCQSYAISPNLQQLWIMAYCFVLIRLALFGVADGKNRLIDGNGGNASGVEVMSGIRGIGTIVSVMIALSGGLKLWYASRSSLALDRMDKFAFVSSAILDIAKCNPVT